MSAIDDIVAQLPMASLAGQVGSDPQNTEAAVRQVLPALLGGLHANAQDPAGAASLAGALGQHSPSLVEGGVNLDQVNTQEGSKIVGNIFGGQTDQVAQHLGGSLGGQTDLVQRLLPLLAPIVLSYVTSRLGGQGQAAQGGGGLADVLGGLMGGQTAGAGGLGGGLGGVLGGLLGGSQGAAPAGGLGDVLGGLLGGGRR
ncbi:MAG: DUF937 domain-containing protein [Janthinobacterium lividum]